MHHYTETDQVRTESQFRIVDSQLRTSTALYLVMNIPETHYFLDEEEDGTLIIYPADGISSWEFADGVEDPDEMERGITISNKE